MSELRKKTHMVLGMGALLLGLYINLVALLVIAKGRGNAYEAIRFIIALILFWMGYRAIKLARSPEYSLKRRVTLWKVALGAIIIYSAIHSYYFPAPNLLKADNAEQQQGMFVVMVLFTLFGLWVLYKGFETRFGAHND